MGNLNSINDGGEFEIIYCNIDPEESELGKENTGKHQANFFFKLASSIKETQFLFLFLECLKSFVMHHL